MAPLWEHVFVRSVVVRNQPRIAGLPRIQKFVFLFFIYCLALGCRPRLYLQITTSQSGISACNEP